jgi:hypothetical protein
MSTLEQRAMQRLVMMLFLMMFMAAEYFFIQAFEEAAPVFIAVANAVVPQVLWTLSNVFEVHETEGQQLSSSFHKTTTFRYFNSVIAVYLMGSFEEQLDGERLLSLQNILISDAIVTPLIYTFNVMSIFNKVIVSRFVKDEEYLALLLSGDNVRLSERYSNVGKCIFVALFYLPILPTNALLGAVALLMCTLADRHGLLYTWKDMANANGTELMQVLYIHVALAIAVHIFMAARFFAGWPNDGACAAHPEFLGWGGGGAGAAGGGTAALFSAAGARDAIVGHVSNLQGQLAFNASAVDLAGPGGGAMGFFVCDKRPPAWDGPDMFASVGSWMTDEQIHLVNFYKFAFGTLAVGASVLFFKFARGWARELFFVHFQQTDNTVVRNWSHVDGILCYVPQVQLPVLRYPLIACDRSLFHSSHIPWDCDYEKFDVYADAMEDHGPQIEEQGAHTLFGCCRVYADHDEGLAQGVQDEADRQLACAAEKREAKMRQELAQRERKASRHQKLQELGLVRTTPKPKMVV